MSDPGYSKGQCQNCGGHLEFPATGMGLLVDCPHCGGQTTLVFDPPDDPSKSRNSPARPKSKLPAVAGSAVFILILVTAGMALYWFKKPEPNPPTANQAAPPITTNSVVSKKPPPATEENDLFITGPVALQKTEGSALIYAVGTVRNNSERQRFGVKIELDLLDDQDNKIGTAGDYLAILEPHKDWQFRALLTQPRTVKAQVAKIEEQR